MPEHAASVVAGGSYFLIRIGTPDPGDLSRAGSLTNKIDDLNKFLSTGEIADLRRTTEGLESLTALRAGDPCACKCRHAFVPIRDRHSIADALAGTTQQGNRVSRGLLDGDINFNTLGDELFERYYRALGGCDAPLAGVREWPWFDAPIAWGAHGNLPIHTRRLVLRSPGPRIPGRPVAGVTCERT